MLSVHSHSISRRQTLPPIRHFCVQHPYFLLICLSTIPANDESVASSGAENPELKSSKCRSRGRRVKWSSVGVTSFNRRRQTAKKTSGRIRRYRTHAHREVLAAGEGSGDRSSVKASYTVLIVSTSTVDLQGWNRSPAKQGQRSQCLFHISSP